MTAMKAPDIQMALDFGGDHLPELLCNEAFQTTVGAPVEHVLGRKLSLVYSAPAAKTAIEAKSKEARVLQSIVAHARALGW